MALRPFFFPASRSKIFEILTWTQFGIHSKPIGILNVKGFYNKLFDFLDHAVHQRFIKEEHRKIFIVSETPSGVISGINKALDDHELIKISLLESSETPRFDGTEQIAQTTNAECIQVLGKIILLYRENPKTKKVILPA